MNPQKKQEWQPEKFPQPQTYPNGWDSSAFFAANGDASVDFSEMPDKNEVETDWQPEKFPKPRTYPRCWSIDD